MQAIISSDLQTLYHISTTASYAYGAHTITVCVPQRITQDMGSWCSLFDTTNQSQLPIARAATLQVEQYTRLDGKQLAIS